MSNACMTAEFRARAKAASTPIINDDLFRGPAKDYLRILTFAGFDPKRLMLAAFKRTARRDTWKINQPTIERAFDDCYVRDLKTGKYVDLATGDLV